jgi:hypothetical protein
VEKRGQTEYGSRTIRKEQTGAGKEAEEQGRGKEGKSIKSGGREGVERRRGRRERSRGRGKRKEREGNKRSEGIKGTNKDNREVIGVMKRSNALEVIKESWRKKGREK